MGIFGHNSRVSKSKWLHVLIFWFFLHKSEVYSVDSSKVFGYFPEVLNFQSVTSQPVHL